LISTGSLSDNEGVKAKELFTRAKDLECAYVSEAPSELNKNNCTDAPKNTKCQRPDIESIFYRVFPKKYWADNAADA